MDSPWNIVLAWIQLLAAQVGPPTWINWGYTHTDLFFSIDSSIYQSDGLCYDTCIDDYAFAIVQGQDCWCSDYVPGTTTSTSDCNNPCPGYPDDSCGGDDTFGYMALTKSPSGTKGATSASSTSTSTSTSSSSAKVSTRTHFLPTISPVFLALPVYTSIFIVCRVPLLATHLTSFKY